MRNDMHYEKDNGAYSADAYRVRQYPGVAFYILGLETAPDEDTEWSGIEERTGRVVGVMIGDDQKFSLDPNDVSPLKRESYCGVCGQIGCHCDGYHEDSIS